YGVTALLALAPIAVMLRASVHASNIIYSVSLVVTLTLGMIGLISLFERTSVATLPLGLPWLGAHFRVDTAYRLLHYCRQSWRRGREFICAWLRTARARA